MDLPVTGIKEQTGGAIYYSCEPDFEYGCNVVLTENIFMNNSATNKGGALRWVNKNFTSTGGFTRNTDGSGRLLQEFQDSNVFVRNFAKYGPN